MPNPGPLVTGVSRFASALAEACVLAALVVTPLYFNPETQRVFEPDKLAWILLLGLAALWALIMAGAEEGRAAWHRPSALVLAMLALGLVITASSLPIHSVIPVTSLFGSYYRGRGLLALLSLLVLGLAAARAAGSADGRRRWQQALLAPVVPVALYALFQRLHIDFISWDIYGQGAEVRAFGPLGNSLILGAYLMMTLPFSVAGFMAAGEGSSDKSASPTARRAIYGLLALLALGGLLASQSRGPVMGLLAGLGLMAVVWTAQQGRRRFTLGLVAAAALGLVALAVLGRSADSPLGRLGSLLASGSRTAQERRLVWEALEHVAADSADAAANRPGQLWLGFGPDTLMYVLPPAVSPELVRLTPEQIFDRAHNNLWEWWVSAGLLGVAAFLALFLSAFGTAFRLLGIVRNRAQMAGLLAAQIGGAVLLGLIPVAAGERELAAVGIPAGLVAGAAVYAALWSWRRSGADGGGSSASNRPESKIAPLAALEDGPAARWLTLALMGAVAAYLVEGSVGIPSAPEDLLFWTSLGALAGLALATSRRHAESINSETDEASSRPGSAKRLEQAAAASPDAVTTFDSASARRSGHIAEAVLDALVLSTVLFAPLLHPQPGANPLSPASAFLWLLLPAALIGLWALHEAIFPTATPSGAHAGRKRRQSTAPLAVGARPYGRMLVVTVAIVLVFRFVYFVLGTFTGGGAIAFALLLVGSVVAIASLRSESMPISAPTEYWRWVPYASLGLVAMLAAWRVGLTPILADAYLRDGLQAAANTRFDQARTDFDQALAMWPFEPLYATFVSGAYRERFLDPNAAKADQDAGFARAEEVLHNALQLAPSDQLFQRLGTLYRDKGDRTLDNAERVQSWQQAQEAYLNALDFAPLRPDTLADLGGLFERTGAISETIQAYERAFDLNPARRDAAAGLMRVALAQGKVATAAEWLDRLQAQNQDHPERVEEALKAGEELPTGSVAARQSEVMLLARQGKVKEAKDLLDQVLRDNENAPANLPLAAWLTKESQAPKTP